MSSSEYLDIDQATSEIYDILVPKYVRITEYCNSRTNPQNNYKAFIKRILYTHADYQTLEDYIMKHVDDIAKDILAFERDSATYYLEDVLYKQDVSEIRDFFLQDAPKAVGDYLNDNVEKLEQLDADLATVIAKYLASYETYEDFENFFREELDVGARTRANDIADQIEDYFKR
jgi:hypothetical protein